MVQVAQHLMPVVGAGQEVIAHRRVLAGAVRLRKPNLGLLLVLLTRSRLAVAAMAGLEQT